MGIHRPVRRIEALLSLIAQVASQAPAKYDGTRLVLEHLLAVSGHRLLVQLSWYLDLNSVPYRIIELDCDGLPPCELRRS